MGTVNCKALLLDLIEQGITLDVDDQKLIVSGNLKSLDSAQKQAIKDNKQAIVRYINQRQRVVKPIMANTKAGDECVLSFAQQRLWFIDQMDGSTQYNLANAFGLTGDFNQDCFERALGVLLERHPVLRTQFVERDGNAVQVVQPVSDFTLEEISLESLTPEAQAREIQRRVKAEAEGAFDLSRDLLLRASILRLASNQRVLLLTTHHIAFDGVSLGIFTQELSALYQAFVQGKANPLPPQRVQYTDFAQWQRDWLQGDVLQQELDFWGQYLNDIPAVHSLPLDKPRQPKQSFGGVRHVQKLGPELSQQIKRQCQSLDVTLFIYLQTTFSLLLARYSHETDIVMGTPIAGRTQSEIENLIGFFVNTLVLRCDLKDNPNFSRLLEKNKQSILDVYTHQHIPFEKLVDELQPERSLSHNALYQIVFAVQNFTQGNLELPGLTFHAMDDGDDQLKLDYELGLHVTETDQELILNWTCSTDVFNRQTLVRLANSFDILLRDIQQNPHQTVQKLKVISEAEQELLLTQWNNTASDYPRDASIHQLFEHQAERFPTQVAAIFEEQHIDYQTLNRDANQLAGYLLAQGVKPDTLVGLCVERSLDMLVGLLGILKAGGAYVPIDPSLPHERIDYLIDDSGIELVLTQSDLMAEMPFEELKVLPLDASMRAHLLATYSTDNPETQTSAHNPEQLAYVIYTSGSTGQPKGVMATHQNVVRLVSGSSDYTGIEGPVTTLLAAPITFDAATLEVWVPLLSGGTAVCYAQDKLEVDRLNQTIIQNDVQLAWLTAGLFDVWVDSEGVENTTLQTLITGGDVVSSASVKKLYERHPTIRLVNGYGPTECVTFSCCYPVPRDFDFERPIPIGGPIADTKVYVLSLSQEPVAIGAAGELYIGGDGVSRGYLKRDEMTAQKFIVNPFVDSNADHLYRTGDLVRWLANGELEFIGRADHQIKLRGFRIELGEIEHQLMRCPDVDQAVVLLQTNKGEQRENNKRLVAYITFSQTESETADNNEAATAKTFLQKQLPEYMVPTVFVVVANMPLTANGKIDRRALAKLSVSDQPQVDYVAPTNETEKTLCDLWSSVIGLKKVGVKDNFFSIGGDSILSIRVVSQAKLKGLELSVKDLFKYQTIAELAEQIINGSLAVNQHQAIEPFGLLTSEELHSLGDDYLTLYDDAYPMSELQQGMVYHTQLAGNGQVYHDLGSFKVKFPWELESFKQALSFLFQQHPVLRSGYRLEGDRPLQLIHKTCELPLFVEDIRHLTSSEQDEFIIAWLAQEKATPFNWMGPLFKVFIHLRSDTTFDFGMSFHHAVYDGWSNSTFVSQLFLLFQDLMAGKPLPSIADDTAFREFVALEQIALNDAKVKKYWTEMLADAPLKQVNTRVGDNAAQSNQLCQGFLVEGLSELSRPLIQFARKLGVPLQSLLLAVHCKILALLSGQPKALTSVVLNGRPERTGGDQGLGLFLNSVPVCFEVGAVSWATLVRQVADTMSRNIENRHYPSSAIQRDTGRTYSEVIFNYTHFHALQALSEKTDIEFLDFQGFEQTNYDLVMAFSRAVDNDQLSMVLTYNTALYDEKTIARMGQYYIQALNAMLQNPDALHFETCLLNQVEKQGLVSFSQQQKESQPASANIVHLFETQAEKTPENIAVVCEKETLSYQALNTQANQLAGYLIENGVTPGAIVGLGIERSSAMVVAMLAVLKTGAAYLHLETEMTQETLDQINHQTPLSLTLTDSWQQEILKAANLKRVCLDTLADQQVLSRYACDNKVSNEVKLQPSLIASIAVTGANQGAARLVRLSHENLVATFSQSDRFTFGPEEVVAMAAHPSTAISGFEIWGALCHGSRLIAIDTVILHDADKLAAKLSDQGVSFLYLPGALFNRTVFKRPDCFTTLNTLLFGGQRLNSKAVNAVLEKGKPGQLLHTYGLTEAGGISTCRTLTAEPLIEYPNPSIGKPLAGLELYILDSFSNPAPAGALGQLAVSGRAVSPGYLLAQAVEGAHFIANPLSRSGGKKWLLTGDLARYDDNGEVVFVGRVDEQRPSTATRVEVEQIESEIINCSGINQAKVTVSADDSDPSQSIICAYVVLDPQLDSSNQNALVAGYRAQLQQKLPNHLIPGVFFALEAFPLNPRGQIDLEQLPSPQGVSIPLAEYVAPRSEIEIKLCGMWQEILRIPRVGVEDNFFVLGGHSLSATRLAIAILQEFEVDLPLSVLFQDPTVQAIAKIIQSKVNYNQLSELNEKNTEEVML